jgi:hypothetical protein
MGLVMGLGPLSAAMALFENKTSSPFTVTVH